MYSWARDNKQSDWECEAGRCRIAEVGAEIKSREEDQEEIEWKEREKWLNEW